MKPTIPLAFLATAVALTGCRSSDSVVFATATHVGVEVNAAEGGQQQANVGYKRFEGVVMPHRRPKEPGQRVGAVLPKPFVVQSRFDMRSGSMFLPNFSLTNDGASSALIIHSVFATGRAAAEPKALQSVANDHKELKK